MSDSPPPSPLIAISEAPLHGRIKQAIILREVPEYMELCALRKQGWNNYGLDHYFSEQRQRADSADEELEYGWFCRMKGVMKEIDEGAHCISFAPIKFLDLGCCPGGFTSYILGKNPRATGVGVSLDVGDGGHACLLESSFHPRFELKCADLLSWSLGRLTREYHQELQPDPFAQTRQMFNVVLLDGHYLRTYKNASSSDGLNDRQRLLIAQLIVALRTVTRGGTLVVKLSQPDAGDTAVILYMLFKLSRQLRLWKPRTMHATRGTFYAVAKGVGLGEFGEDLQYHVDWLRGAWDVLYDGGQDGDKRYIDDQDFAPEGTVEELLEHFLPRLIEISSPVWRVQCQALQRWFERRGITEA